MSRRAYHGEEGQALLLLAVALVGILGFAALALDGGNLYTEQRRAQAAADNAVMAAAYTRMRGITDTVTLRGLALASAAGNDYSNDAASNWVAYYKPPLHGPLAGNNAYMEVMITQTVPTALAHLVFGISPIPVTVYAVAHATPPSPIMPGYAIAAFHVGCDANNFTPRGGVGSIIKDGGVFVNSEPGCEESINTSGGGARLATTSSGDCPDDSIPPDQPGGCFINGGYPIDIGGLQDSSESDVCPAPPPAIDWWSSPGTVCNFYPAPNEQADQIIGFDIGLDSSDFTCGPNRDSLLTGAGPYTLQPGSYTDMNTAGGNGDLFLQPGIYCITSTGPSFSIMNADSIIGHGVFIYIADPAAEFKFAGNGTLDLSAPFDGENGLNCAATPNDPLCKTVKGIVLFKPDGLNTCDNDHIGIDFSGNGDMVVRGLIWAPEDYLAYTGNGNLYQIGQALVGCVKYAGNGELDITYSPENTYGPPPSVRLDE